MLFRSLLAGRRPFSGNTAVELLASILRQEPPPLRRGDDRIAPELERLVLQMLAKDRDRRPAHMR